MSMSNFFCLRCLTLLGPADNDLIPEFDPAPLILAVDAECIPDELETDPPEEGALPLALALFFEFPRTTSTEWDLPSGVFPGGGGDSLPDPEPPDAEPELGGLHAPLKPSVPFLFVRTAKKTFEKFKLKI